MYRINDANGYKMDYKKRITELQNQRNWSMNRLAVESGLNPSTISNWFSRGTTPTTDAIEKLCVAFGISVATFFDPENTSLVPTAEQCELLKQWDRLLASEKKDLLKFITTVNANRKRSE